MSLRLEMLQVARLAPKLLGDSTDLVADFFRAQHHPSGPALERWLRFAIRHEDLVGRACAADARALLVDRYGIHVWDALVEVGVREDITHRHALTIAALLERQRGPVENPWSTREIRRAAFDVAFRHAYHEEGQEST